MPTWGLLHVAKLNPTLGKVITAAGVSDLIQLITECRHRHASGLTQHNIESVTFINDAIKPNGEEGATHMIERFEE